MSNQILRGDPAKDPRSVANWLHIDDFSPGIWNNSFISTANGIVPAPLGAAEEIGTWCCGALGAGGLGPLPGLKQIYGFFTSYPAGVTEYFVTGFIVNPGLDSGNDEIIQIFEADALGAHYVNAYSDVPAISSVNKIAGVSENWPSAPGYFGSPYPVWTRMTIPTTTTIQPVLVFPTAVVTDPAGTNGHLWVYPELLNPSSFTAQDINSGSGLITGQTIAYGSRILVLEGIDYQWPAGGGINTNENIAYTDPT